MVWFAVSGIYLLSIQRFHLSCFKNQLLVIWWPVKRRIWPLLLWIINFLVTSRHWRSFDLEFSDKTNSEFGTEFFDMDNFFVHKSEFTQRSNSVFAYLKFTFIVFKVGQGVTQTLRFSSSLVLSLPWLFLTLTSIHFQHMMWSLYLCTGFKKNGQRRVELMCYKCGWV